MSQSSITAAALLIAFFIFITVRGELGAYLGTLGIGSQAIAGASGSTGTTTTTSTGGSKFSDPTLQTGFPPRAPAGVSVGSSPDAPVIIVN